MNRIGKKELAADAAKLFEAEVLALKPDIPRKELCAMVDDYIYYQTDEVSREEAHAMIEATCISGPERAIPRSLPRDKRVHSSRR
jgi:hypothetical protein